MANDPPPAPQVPSSTSTGDNTTTDPYNLNYQGVGILSATPIRGAYEVFGLPTTIESSAFHVPFSKAFTQSQARPAATATETINFFTHLSGIPLAQIQSQLYRAGFYSGNFQPTYGILRPEDISAFRSAIVGLASNPSAMDLGTYLSSAAAAGDAQGTNARQHTPLVTKLTNPDDIRAMIQSGANNLFGKYLSEDDIQKFIKGYQGQEAAYQQSAYAATGYNPDTGQQDLGGPSGAAGTTLTKPATDAAGVSLQFAKQFYADHPVTAEMAQFVNNFDGLKNLLTQELPGGTHK